MVVAQLLRRANEDTSGDLWASLSDVLPLLAEAAPDVFLRAVQEGVAEQSEPVLANMFLDREQRDAFSVSSPHTALLWALETVAWSEDHAPLAIKGGSLRSPPAARLRALAALASSPAAR